MKRLKPDKKRYQRKELAELVGITPNTIKRREDAGKVPKPIKVKHSGDVYYTPEMVLAHLEFQEAEIIPPFDVERCDGCAHPLLYCICYLFREEETMEYERTNSKMRKIIDTALEGIPTLEEKEAFLMGLRFGITVMKETEEELNMLLERSRL